tara:strand:+ start:25622 stop:25885 length:264 start_codon:yes stop_codon:yes gene_type:complete
MNDNHPTTTFVLSDAIDALRTSEERMQDPFAPIEQMVGMLQATLAIIMRLTSSYDESNFTGEEIDLVHRVTTLASEITNEMFTGENP